MNQSQSKNNCGLLGFKPVGAFVLDQTVLSWQLLGFVFKRKKKSNDDIYSIYKSQRWLLEKKGNIENVVYSYERNEVAWNNRVLGCQGLLDSFIERFNLLTGHTETRTEKKDAQHPIMRGMVLL